MERLITIVTSRSIVVDAPRQVVIDFLTNVNNWARAHPGSAGILNAPEEPAPLGLHFIEKARIGDDIVDLEWIVNVDERPEKFAVTLGESPWSIKQIDIIYEFAEVEGGTEFTRSTRFIGEADDLVETAGQSKEQFEFDNAYLDILKKAIEEHVAASA